MSSASPLRFAVSGYSPAVSYHEVDLSLGTSRLVASTEVGENPTFLARGGGGGGGGGVMYAILEVDGGRTVAFAPPSSPGAPPSPLGDVSSGGAGPCHVALDPSGAHVLSANYGSGHVSVARVGAGGLLGGAAAPAVYRPGDNAHQVVFSPDGRFVFVPCLGSGYIAQYVYDGATGALTPNATAPTAAVPAGAGPRHVAFNPAYPVAYVLNELITGITTFDYDAAEGTLSGGETLPAVPRGSPEPLYGAHVEASPDGRFVYASARGRGAGTSCIAVFAVGERGRLLSPPVQFMHGLAWPRDFALSRDGRALVVANQHADTVCVYARDVGSGALTLVGEFPTAPTRAPACVVFV